MRPAIPLSAPGRLRRAARRTAAARLVLGAALAGTLAAAFLVAHGTKSEGELLPGGRSPVLALDLSWSVSYSKSKLIARTLRDFVDSGRRIGLVLFSDTAYEALPPGTRSAALAPFLRFFDGTSPGNPWRATFSGGTRISAALDLARQMLQRDGIGNGSVTLISDLSDSPNDQPDLARLLVTYQRERIPIRIVAVNPTAEDERFFRSALKPGGGSVTTLREGTGSRPRPPAGSSFPVALVVAAGVIALLLALNEQVLGSLTWGRRQPT